MPADGKLDLTRRLEG